MSARTRSPAQNYPARPKQNLIFGDAGVAVTDFARGGDDTLTAGNSTSDPLLFNDLFGDATTMSGKAQGGNERPDWRR